MNARKPTRLKDFDYSQNGTYFVTICTKNRKCVLSDIYVGQGLAPAETKLSIYGSIAQQELLSLEKKFCGVKIDKYAIMPNHIHCIIRIDNNTAGASPCPTLSHIICTFKSLTTRKCNHHSHTGSLFQSSFYDHIIRNEKDYLKIWEYIDNNATKWKTDKYFSIEKTTV